MATVVNGYTIEPGADLSGADLRDADLNGAILSRADLSDADLTARIFLRLLPDTRRVGATTFGDAQDLCAHAAEKIRDLRPYE